MGFGPKIDFSGVPPALEEEFLKGRHAREVMAALDGIKNQESLNAQAARPHRSIDGLGRPTAYIDPYVYWHWAAREGSPDVWQDKFHKRYMKRAGMQFVEARGTKLQVQGAEVPGRSKGDTRKFHKNYGPLK